LNLPDLGCDQRLAPSRTGSRRQIFSPGGRSSMKTVRPNNPDPMPLRSSPHGMGTIMIRFVGLLVLAVVVLALVWSR
jgi:hypothetical protein